MTNKKSLLRKFNLGLAAGEKLAAADFRVLIPCANLK
jgi:hypothetical protein